MNETEKFFEGLPSEDKQLANIFNEKKPDEKPLPGEGTESKGDEDEEETKESRKNRRERRLEERMQEKDDMLLALNERVIELSEAAKLKQEFTISDQEPPAEWIALYGTTQESKDAWKVQASLFAKATATAKEEALREFRDEQQKAVEEQKHFESLIDQELESLEDEYDIDLTSNAPSARKNRREFLELVQDLSPKDESGAITNYADFGKTFEVYQKTRQKEKPSETVNKQKELAARSMQKPEGQGKEGKLPTPGFNGWRKDYGL